jgi:hypothetical protein
MRPGKGGENEKMWSDYETPDDTKRCVRVNLNSHNNLCENADTK